MEKLQITLEAARVNAGMTQKEVAMAMNVDRTTVIRWEKAKKIPNYDESEKLEIDVFSAAVDFELLEDSLERELAKSEKIADYLGVPIEKLLE